MPHDDPDREGLIVIEDDLLREGFVALPKIVLHLKGLSVGAKVVYAALLGYAWQEGSCFPGQRRLATDLDIGLRSTVRYIQELQQEGLLKVTRRGLGKTNVYTLPRLKCQSGTSGSASRSAPEVPNRHFPSCEVQTGEVDAESLTPIASRFLQQIGYGRPSKAKRERTLRILKALAGQDGFGLDEIVAACDIAAGMGARGAELIPHVIGRKPRTPLDHEVGQRYLAEAQHDAQRWRNLTQRFEGLPSAEQQALIDRARATSPILLRRPANHPLVKAAAVALLGEGPPLGPSTSP
jgi:hypothetical protein